MFQYIQYGLIYSYILLHILICSYMFSYVLICSSMRKKDQKLQVRMCWIYHTWYGHRQCSNGMNVQQWDCCLILVGWSPCDTMLEKDGNESVLVGSKLHPHLYPRLATWSPWLKLALHDSTYVQCFNPRVLSWSTPNLAAFPCFRFSICLDDPKPMDIIRSPSSSGPHHRPWTRWRRRFSRAHPSAPRGPGIGQRCLESRATCARRSGDLMGTFGADSFFWMNGI